MVDWQYSAKAVCDILSVGERSCTEGIFDFRYKLFFVSTDMLVAGRVAGCECHGDWRLDCSIDQMMHELVTDGLIDRLVDFLGREGAPGYFGMDLRDEWQLSRSGRMQKSP